MITVYPYESDWEDLATLTGNDSLAPDKMRGYFKRATDTFPGACLTQLTLVLQAQKLLYLVLAATAAQLKDFVKREAWRHHACCTAAIGSDEDANAVLDSDFRVRGVNGLRLVDASVFPKIPGWHIALPIYMISEKAADVILAEVA